jgi:hypothetical protein
VKFFKMVHNVSPSSLIYASGGASVSIAECVF